MDKFMFIRNKRFTLRGIWTKITALEGLSKNEFDKSLREFSAFYHTYMRAELDYIIVLRFMRYKGIVNAEQKLNEILLDRR